MIITAYKCIDTGKIFENLKDYKTHRAGIYYRLRKEREFNKKQSWLNGKWQEMCDSVSTIKELEQWVTANWEVFDENYYQHYYGSRNTKLPKLVEFKVITASYYENYWNLRVTLRLSSETPSFIGRYFEDSVMKSTGGGGCHAKYNQYFDLDANKFHLLTTRYLLTMESK